MRLYLFMHLIEDIMILYKLLLNTLSYMIRIEVLSSYDQFKLHTLKYTITYADINCCK